MTQFIDHIKIFCQSGKGGTGLVNFRRERFVPKGKADGGDGGDGGSIYIVGDRNLWTLFHLRYRKHIFADNGVPGGKNNKNGKKGKDITLKIPLGTVIKDTQTDEIFIEIIEHGEKKLLLKGGKGGWGNAHFQSSINSSPQKAQKGEKGEKKELQFSLKILADVGLVGFPNAGKSTLLSVLSAAKPKIADYPFTTLTPKIGIVSQGENSFVMADIPGIIEGSAEGRGLGHEFLKHIERTKILVFIISVEDMYIKKQYELLHNEVKKFHAPIILKKKLIIISKTDLIDDTIEKQISEDLDIPHFFISSHKKIGLEKLKNSIWQLLQDERNPL